MQYFVLDGANRYGPADVNTLNLWAAEGRLRPDMMFEEAGTGRQLRAFEIQGLNIHVGGASVTQATAQANPVSQQPLSGQFANPQSQEWMRPPTGTYYRAPGMVVDPAAKQIANTAVILGIVSIFCGCLPAAIVALVMGINAQGQANNGDPRAMQTATTARVWGIVAICIGVVAGILWFFVAMASAMGGVH